MRMFFNGLMVFIISMVIGSPDLYGQQKGELIKQAEVKNGHVIINGRYIEPPYLIEIRENGIWINGVLAEKIIPRKERYRKIRKIRIQNEIYADYFELGEKIGWDKAIEKIKENLMKDKEIKNIKIKSIRLKKGKPRIPHEIEMQLDSGGRFKIKLETKPSKRTGKRMFGRLLNKKYAIWYRASSKDKKKALEDLVVFLEKEKKKGRIDQYKFEKGYEFEEKDTLKVKYGSYWGTRSDWHHLWSASVEERQLPSDEEADRLDKDDIQRRVKTFERALNGGYLEVFSQGRNRSALPGGRSIISELKRITADRSISLEERKERIKKVYLPASTEDKLLQEILDNFNR